MKATITKYILMPLLMAVMLCGCNQEDDIDEIFTSNTWHWSLSGTTTNWKDDNNFKPITSKEEQFEINKDRNIYTIKFEKDGNFKAKGNSIEFKGMWSADPKDHSVQISNVQIHGNAAGLDRMFYNEICNAQFYRGSSLLLKLLDSNKKEFIQFYPIK